MVSFLSGVHRVTVEYKNHHESPKRCTTRGIRDLIMIHPVDELNILQEFGEIATIADVKKDYVMITTKQHL